jgi:RNA polymerase sigma-70 factor (ECF subfamily)
MPLDLSQNLPGRRCSLVSTTGETIVEMCARASDSAYDVEALFREHYGRVARVIARVVRDYARAEELAVEVFLKLSRRPPAHAREIQGWLYRVAVRTALDDVRRQTRRSRYEALAGFYRDTPTPEEIHAASEEQRRVRSILARMDGGKAELLVLRLHGLDYQELAATLGLNPSSVGKLLSRAQESFRKEYVKRYGPQ